MKETELRKNATCSVCRNLIGKTGVPAFWTVKVEHHVIRMDAVRRQDGLTAMMDGHARLAQVMGQDAEMTNRIGEPIELTVCENCSRDEMCLLEVVDRERNEQNQV